MFCKATDSLQFLFYFFFWRYKNKTMEEMNHRNVGNKKEKDKCFQFKKVQHFTEWRFLVLLSELWD